MHTPSPSPNTTGARRWAGRAAAALAGALGLLAGASSALAHPGSRLVRRNATEFTELTMDQWLVWDFHESIVIGILCLMTLYGLGLTVWRTKHAITAPIKRWQTGLFYANMVMLWFTLDGPLHHLSDELLFSAHMVQHLILQLIWAPLLVISVPGWMLAPLVPEGSLLQRVGRWVSRPVVAFIIFNGTLLFWHVPSAYNLALVSHPWHIAEHILFMVTAVIMWWPIYGRLDTVPRPTHGKQMLYLFGHMAVMKAMGMVITMTNSVIYEFYTTQPRVFGLTPLGDQRVGGLIMWLPAGFSLWVALAYVFTQWRRVANPDTTSTPVAAASDADDVAPLDLPGAEVAPG